jgi:hypothetical protein
MPALSDSDIKAILPSQSALCARLRYDPQSGFLFWRDSGKRAGTKTKSGRVYVGFDRKMLLAHRVIWKMLTGEEPPMVDHKNCDPSDNRWTNLRAATHAQNNSNQRARHSGLKGAYFHRASGLWAARVTSGGRLVHCSYHATEQAAHDRYAEVAKSFFGEFARAA